VAVAAVLGELGFQLIDPLLQEDQLRGQPFAPGTSRQARRRRGGKMERPIAHAAMLHEREEKYKC
jgi:hypothetical protein